MNQGDLFENYQAENSLPQEPDPDQIRVRLHNILKVLRGADTFPWSEAELRSWRIVFPNMTKWLPEEERADLRKEFFAELERWQMA